MLIFTIMLLVFFVACGKVDQEDGDTKETDEENDADHEMDDDNNYTDLDEYSVVAEQIDLNKIRF